MQIQLLQLTAFAMELVKVADQVVVLPLIKVIRHSSRQVLNLQSLVRLVAEILAVVPREAADIGLELAVVARARLEAQSVLVIMAI
jgi:hypothetical protein